MLTDLRKAKEMKGIPWVCALSKASLDGFQSDFIAVMLTFSPQTPGSSASGSGDNGGSSGQAKLSGFPDLQTAEVSEEISRDKV